MDLSRQKSNLSFADNQRFEPEIAEKFKKAAKAGRLCCLVNGPL